MPRHPHFRVDELSEEARRIIRDGLDRNRREKAIIEEVSRRTGERIAVSSFNRYAAWYRGQIRRRQEVQERVEVAVETAIKHGAQMTTGLKAELLEVMFDAARDGKLAQMPPYFAGILALKIADSERKEQELGLQREKLGVERDRLAMAQNRLETIRHTAAKALPAPEGGQPQISAADAIREIFGVASET